MTKGVHNLIEEEGVIRDLLRIAVIVASVVVFSIRAGVSHADRFTLADIRERCAAPEGSEEFAFFRGYVVALIDAVIVRHDPAYIPTPQGRYKPAPELYAKPRPAQARHSNHCLTFLLLQHATG